MISKPLLGGSRPPSPVLPYHSSLVKPPRTTPVRFLYGVACLTLLYLVSVYPAHVLRPRFGARQLLRTVTEWQEGSCAHRGLISTERGRWDKGDDGTTVAVRIKAIDIEAVGQVTVANPDGVILAPPFHPSLSSIFSPSQPRVTNNAPWGCMIPEEHVVEHASPLMKPTPDPILFHAMCTTPERVVSFAPIWHHFLSSSPADHPEGTSIPGCVVVDATPGKMRHKAYEKANRALQLAGTTCEFRDSSLPRDARYEHRVLNLVKDVWIWTEEAREVSGGPLIEWFILGDDDTWWVDQTLLKERLSLLDHRQEHFLGSRSETANNLKMFGNIAFGGAGIILSRAMMEMLQPHLQDCFDKFGEQFGGDSMMTHCVAMVQNTTIDDALEIVPGLAQMDMKGDATGFLSGGLGPFITLHHWAGWLELMPHRVQTEVIELFRQTVVAVGGHNFLRRWIFDEGRVSWTLGYAVVVYKQAMAKSDLDSLERTWEDHIPVRPSRPSLVEGVDKFTYYLTAVESLSPTTTLFRHRCTSPSVAGTVSEIVVVWEKPGEQDDALWWRMGAEDPNGGLVIERALKERRRRLEEGSLLEV